MPLTASAEATPQWLRQQVHGEQQPRLVASQSSHRDAWQDVRTEHLMDKLGQMTRVCMFITPNGILGYYNPALVEAFVRGGRPWGRITHPTVMPQGEVPLPHLQISNGITLGTYMKILERRAAGDYVFCPEERTYLRTVGGVLPTVAPYMAPEIPIDAATCANVSFYVSQAGMVTNLHFDAYSGTIHQLRGRKRVLLFAPEEKSHFSMYPNRHLFARRSTMSEKITEATVAAHADIQGARGWECVIEPDQWLYVPAGWLHHVETLDDDTLSIITRFTR